MGRAAVDERLYGAVKSAVFATPGLNRAASRWRARAVESAYTRVLHRYAGLPTPPEAPLELLRQRGGDRLERFRLHSGRPRILFVGTDILQDSAGLLQGLGEIGDVLPYTQADGRYGQLTHEGNLSFALARPNGERLVELVGSAKARGAPFDLVVGQMWDGYIDLAALDEIRERFGALVVNLAMDDRHAYTVRKLGREVGTRSLAPFVDLTATAAPEAVDWYRKERCPALFLPEASDAELFRPMPEVPKRYDVTFVGGRYGIRERLVERLRCSAINVQAYGTGWAAGRIATEAVPRLFAESRILLGISTIGHSEQLCSLKMRDFDAPMSGSCYVTYRNPDLEQLYRVGEEIAVYEDEQDCVRTVRALLGNDEHREGIARLGRERAERDHTWAARFSSLLGVLRGDTQVARFVRDSLSPRLTEDSKAQD